jgi:hypothetical protein
VIKLTTISDLLGKSVEHAENRVVEFINQFNIRAKIDSVQGEITIFKNN